jgi:hypothetical protein
MVVGAGMEMVREEQVGWVMVGWVEEERAGMEAVMGGLEEVMVKVGEVGAGMVRAVDVVGRAVKEGRVVAVVGGAEREGMEGMVVVMGKVVGGVVKEAEGEMVVREEVREGLVEVVVKVKARVEEAMEVVEEGRAWQLQAMGECHRAATSGWDEVGNAMPCTQGSVPVPCPCWCLLVLATCSRLLMSQLRLLMVAREWGGRAFLEGLKHAPPGLHGCLSDHVLAATVCITCSPLTVAHIVVVCCSLACNTQQAHLACHTAAAIS